MVRAVVALAISATLMAGPASAADAASVLGAFNLECSGTQKTIEGTLLDAKTTHEEPFTETYRIDLDAGKWCYRSCETTTPVFEITDTLITFLHDDNSIVGMTMDHEAVVQRETGKYLERTRFGVMTYYRDGVCRRAPFTGLPKRQF